MEERSLREPSRELAEVIYRQHAFGKSARALAIMHRLSVETVRRTIREYELKLSEASGQDPPPTEVKCN